MAMNRVFDAIGGYSSVRSIFSLLAAKPAILARIFLSLLGPRSVIIAVDLEGICGTILEGGACAHLGWYICVCL